MWECKLRERNPRALVNYAGAVTLSGADFASDFRVERREVPRTPGFVGIYGSGSTGGDWFDEDG